MKLNTTINSLCLIATCFITACSNIDTASNSSSSKNVSNSAATITVNKPSNTQYAKAPLYIPFSDLGLKLDDIAGLNLVDGANSLDFEAIDQNGDGEKDGIFSLLDLSSKRPVVLQLIKSGNVASLAKPTKRTQAEISIKEGGQWVSHPSAEGKKAYKGGTFKNVSNVTLPEYYTDHSKWIRYEGPGIESDKVAYRIYLDHRNGFDIFGKKHSQPVLQKIGLDGYDSYHNMLDWGMDILKVGSSLGAGGFGFWDGSNLTLVSDTQSRSARIIENGNLYSSIAIDYDQWLVDGERRDISALISMQGGSRLAHTRITMEKALPNLAIGMVKHKGTDFLQGKMDGENTYSYIGSWGKQSESGDHLGIAVIFKTKQFKSIVDNDSSYVALMQPEVGKEESVLEYYFVAAWEGEHGNGIASKQAFSDYLESEISKLSLPLEISIKR